MVQNTVSAEISVVLNTAEELTFDTKGNRINTGSFVFGTYGINGGGHQGGGIPVDSLPVEITDFISQNYAAYTIRHARFDSLCQFGDVTEVVLSMDSIQPIKLYFDADNLFVAVASRVLTSDLPELITAAVAATYPEYTLRSSQRFLHSSQGHCNSRYLCISAIATSVL